MRGVWGLSVCAFLAACSDYGLVEEKLPEADDPGGSTEPTTDPDVPSGPGAADGGAGDFSPPDPDTGERDPVVDSGEVPAEDTGSPPVEDPPPDTGSPPVEDPPPDTGSPPVEDPPVDTGTTPLDTGSPPVADPPVDTGTTPLDTGSPPVADPPVDTGTPPLDTGSPPGEDPPVDTGTTPLDTGSPPGEDPPVDTGVADTGEPAVEDTGSEPAGTPCVATIGYWRNHVELWPVTELTLGDETYTQDELVDLLDTPPSGDDTRQLARQLIAAKLGMATGVSYGDLETLIDEADQWLIDNAPLDDDGDGRLPYGSGAAWIGRDPSVLASELSWYNNGNGDYDHC
ncbi:MAG: hypothetical protein ACOZNI_10635 [Myxococcota bacterium]